MNRVTRLKLLLDLPGEHDNNNDVVAEFIRLSTILLTRLGLEAPKELPASIKSARYYLQAQRNGTITFDPGRYPHKLRVLAVRHPRVRVVPIPRANE